MRVWSPSPLWLDEAQTVEFARLPLEELHGALRLDGAPPLYYALLHGWLWLWDAIGLGEGVYAARSLSMLVSIAALPLAYLVGRRLGGTRRHGEITLLVLAANPWAIRYAGEARMYALVVLLVLAGILAADALRRRPGPAPVVAVALVTATLLLTHYWSLFLLATVGVVVLVRAGRHPTERPFARRAVTGLAAGGVVFLPWLPTFLYQSAPTGAPWADPPNAASIAQLPMDWSGGEGPAGATLALALVPLMLLAVFARRSTRGASRGTGREEVTLCRPAGLPALLGVVTLGTLVLALVASMAGNGAVVGRYTAVVVPLVILLVAFGLLTLPRAATLPVLAGVVAVGLVAGLTIVRTTHTHAGRIADVLNARAKPGDLVVYCPDQLAPAIEARLSPKKDLALDRLTVPRQTDPRLVDWIDYTERLEAMGARGAAEDVLTYVRGAETSAVWFVLGKNYRTHEEVCGPLRTRLAASLGVPTVVLSGAARGYEKASLERFGR